MMTIYKTDGARFVETDWSETGNIWIRIQSPDANELRSVTDRLGIDYDDVCGALDGNEISRFKSRSHYTVTFVDVPYDNRAIGASYYNTVSSAIIRTDRALVTVSQLHSKIFDEIAENKPPGMTTEDLRDMGLGILLSIMNRYQRYLSTMNNARREMDMKMDEGLDKADAYALHQMESSIVYFLTSLKAFVPILDKIEKSCPEQYRDVLDDVRVEMNQAIEMAAIYREVIRGTEDLFNTIVNAKLNSIMKLLTLITLVLTVPMIVTGFYGMNIAIPGQESHMAFAFVCALMLGLSGMAVLILWKKKFFE